MTSVDPATSEEIERTTLDRRISDAAGPVLTFFAKLYDEAKPDLYGTLPCHFLSDLRRVVAVTQLHPSCEDGASKAATTVNDLCAIRKELRRLYPHVVQIARRASVASASRASRMWARLWKAYGKHVDAEEKELIERLVNRLAETHGHPQAKLSPGVWSAHVRLRCQYDKRRIGERLYDRVACILPVVSKKVCDETLWSEAVAAQSLL